RTKEVNDQRNWMTVTSVDTDYDSLTITLIADFDAPIERVWDLWSDPRKLERWWGPPTHPATFEKHDLTPGGEATYFMTGPDGAMWGHGESEPSIHQRRWSSSTPSPTRTVRRSRRCRSSRSESGSPSATAAHGWRCTRASNPARTWRGW